ncbi:MULTISPECIES: polysaccharide deacetylase family protein [Streptomyces]|uniref:polysaccharide deacetylase family protein n=1 Tax=Streptomyces TaxID=1883 RepID=UPI001E575EC0|nr:MULTISPECIES: polysaccharide deacetylase [Streptomyces]UFQ19501.1 polysaccharide deacetylase [Streptomyces huasconensis]WCL89120.1 polysaccharide deacetylase [Streptomyces sp. JCM 35825]
MTEPADDTTGQPPRAPWQWREEEWRRHVERVRAGRSLKPARWPHGAKAAVAFSFDPDHETIPLRDAEVMPGKLSQGEYGARVGVPRILRLLERHALPATFFMPAVSALLRPEEARGYVERGHEVALHGWIHERNMELGRRDERDLAFRCAEVLERITGQRPVGIRTPSWDFSEHTLDITLELGLSYDSSLMADDDPYEVLSYGRPTGLVEIPPEWIRDDAVYFNMDRYSAVRPYTMPRHVLGLWQDEFDAAYAEGGLFEITLHPHVIGHRSRAVVLERLLEHVCGRQDVWYATHAQVADHVRREAALGDGLPAA